MKKILALILAVTMIATLCVGCGKEEVKDTPTNPPVDTSPVVDTTTPEESIPEDITEPQPEPDAPIEEPIEDACGDFNTEFSLIAFSNYAMDMAEMNDQLNAAIAEKDTVKCGEIMSTIGQTVIMVPHWEGYTYTAEHMHCTAETKNGPMVSITIAPYAEDWKPVDNLKLDINVKFTRHEGELYEIVHGENESSWAYFGMTDSKMTIAIASSDKDAVIKMGQSIAIIESTQSPAVDFENFKSGLPETEAAAYDDESMAIVHFFFMPTPNEGPGEGAIIRLDTADKIAEQFNKRLAEEHIGIKGIETKYVNGFAIVGTEEVVFYGFDKDTHNAFTVTNLKTVDELFETVKGINIFNGAYFAEAE